MCGGDLRWHMTVNQRQLFTYILLQLFLVFSIWFLCVNHLPWTPPSTPLHRHNVCDTSKCTCIRCCSFHLESITSLQPGSALHRGVCSIKPAAHLNALDSISVEISPVCPGQSIKGPLKKKKRKKEKWSAPDALASISPRLNHTHIHTKKAEWETTRITTNVGEKYRLSGSTAINTS